MSGMRTGMIHTSPDSFVLRGSRRRTTVDVRLGTFRPTALDMRFAGDAWIIDRCDGTLSLCVGNYSLACISGLSFDLASLNRFLERVRQYGRRRR
jgi:hypothetical protein